MSFIFYLEVERLRDEVNSWKGQVRFWQNRHDNFLKQVKEIQVDIDRLKSENKALIFINKELGRINEKLRTELDQAKSGPRSTSRQTSQYILSDEEFSNADDEQSHRPQKKPKTKPKTIIIKSDEIREQDVDAARVCKYNFLHACYNR